MVDQILVGAAIGCLYALIAQGFALTFRTTHTMNFASGEIGAIGAFIAVGLAGAGALPAPVKLAVVAVVVALIGAALFAVLIRPFVTNDGHDARWLLVTVAMSLVAVDVLRNSQGTQHRPLGFAQLDGVFSLGFAQVPQQLALLAVVCLGLGVVIALVVTRTSLGVRMRAVAEDAETAGLVGIDSRRIGMLSYAIGSGAIAIGATLWTGYVGVFPDMGPLLLVPAFAGAVIGGLVSVWGALVGGILYGVADQLFTYWLGTAAGGVIGLLAVVAVLVLRPEGLFARRQEVKV
ncbi:branched-chain amino acid ABC transporter permease [Nocardioides marmoriginsengisoli]|uniref:Branched-chain amino acid ABC transporter permease n=1 Tax=Nocardioides marmoriginsengisoli TaxID=661483 RepID=A0A3N0CPH5_9ACTN|nr:branched-chain amino acid ABC transporter permease [Nocardioides marmoriginsengisoli]RNL65374.1 branched-chain amino acid ABC transporter permease [Nocardioides marmoriginsengisoli]